MSNFSTSLTEKRLELLHEAVPRASTIAVLVNPKTPVTAQSIDAGAEAAAQALGFHLDVFAATSEGEMPFPREATTPSRWMPRSQLIVSESKN